MSKKMSKRKEALLAKIDKEKNYPLTEAVATIKDLHLANFDETVEIALHLNVDPRHADQMIRSSVVLPNGTGKKVTVAVFAKGAKIDEAKEAGADLIGDDALLAEIQNGEINFDIVIASPDMMGVLGRVARILGPKGLMPNPKVGTVTPNIADAVKNAKGGQVNFRVDKKGNIQAGVGKVSFDTDKLQENIATFVAKINKLKPASVKGKYITNAALSLTMSPSVRLDTLELMDIK